LKNIFAFYAKFNDAFERVENLKREDKKCDWATEFVPEWLNCIAITKISTILRAQCASLRPMRTPSPSPRSSPATTSR